jgi:hypothetical protein
MFANKLRPRRLFLPRPSSAGEGNVFKLSSRRNILGHTDFLRQCPQCFVFQEMVHLPSFSRFQTKNGLDAFREICHDNHIFDGRSRLNLQPRTPCMPNLNVLSPVFSGAASTVSKKLLAKSLISLDEGVRGPHIASPRHSFHSSAPVPTVGRG